MSGGSHSPLDRLRTFPSAPDAGPVLAQTRLVALAPPRGSGPNCDETGRGADCAWPGSKLAEVLGLAQATQEAARRSRG
jgi:hypothetical protein